MQAFKAHNLDGTDFFESLRHMSAWDVVFSVGRANPQNPVHVWLWFNCAVVHRILEVAGLDVAIDFAMKAGLSGPKAAPDQFSADPWTPYPEWIRGSVYASNILNRTQHYGEAVFAGYVAITSPGWYRVEIWGKSASDAAPGINGLARVHVEPNTLNQLIVRVDD